MDEIKEKDIAWDALQHLKSAFPKIGFDYDNLSRIGNGYSPDGKLTIRFPDKKRIDLNVEVKGSVSSRQLYHLKLTHKGWDILLAQYLAPPIKKWLEEENIPYLDMVGNGKITLGERFVYFVEGRKNTTQPKQLTNPFNKNGVKLFFHLFLLYSDGFSLTYRDMAGLAGISLSSVGNILKAMKKEGYLLETKKGVFVWDKRRKPEMVDKWTAAYNEKLRSKSLKRGAFRFHTPSQTGNIHRESSDRLPQKTWWGGEPAADLLTNHLQPAYWTLYSSAEKKEVMKALRALPDPKGTLELLSPFWNIGAFAQSGQPHTTPPFLIYVDLILSKNPRNVETAAKIYNEHLKNIF